MSETRLVYAGIGSRRTPDDILKVMKAAAFMLADRGWTLRTGGAPGADEVFFAGCYAAGNDPRFEIYLPWPTFAPEPPKLGERGRFYPRPQRAAYDIAAKYHPAWPYLKRSTIRALHARNSHQILGWDLNDPVQMVVCWTPDGSLDGNGPDTGGTGQALRVAAGEARDAKIFNLARQDHLERILRFIDA